MVDEDFLQMIQRRGWQIMEVTEDSCTAKCRANGCGMAAKMVPGGHIPQVDPGGTRNVTDIELRNYDDVIEAWRARAQGLTLTIKEIEQACGLADDHLAKVVKPNSRKVMNVQTFIDTCNTLGLDVVLRPSVLPRITVRQILDSRDKVESRQRRNAQENARRAEKVSRSE